MTRFRTHVGRAVDPSYPSVRRALNVAVAAGLAGIAFGWVGDGEWQIGAITGLVWAGSSFLAWATTRELHHDFDRPALFAAVLAPLGAAVFGAPSFLAVGVLLLLARVSLGSTGRRPLATDLAVMVAISVWLARTPAGWSVAIVMAVALARLGALGRARAGRLWGLGLAAASTGIMALSGGFSMGELDSAAPVALVVGAAIGFGIAPKNPPTVETDRGGPPPSGADQFVARLLVLVGVIAATLISAEAGFVLPAAVGLIALAIRNE